MFWTLNMYLYYGSRPSADSRPQHPSIHPSIHPSFYYLVLSIVLFFYLLFCHSLFCPSTQHSTVHLSIYLSIYLSGLLSDCLSVVYYILRNTINVDWLMALWQYAINILSKATDREKSIDTCLFHSVNEAFLGSLPV